MKYINIFLRGLLPLLLSIIIWQFGNQILNQKKEIERKNRLIVALVKEQNEDIKRMAHLAYDNGKLIGIDVGRKGRNFDQSFEVYWFGFNRITNVPEPKLENTKKLK